MFGTSCFWRSSDSTLRASAPSSFLSESNGDDTVRPAPPLGVWLGARGWGILKTRRCVRRCVPAPSSFLSESRMMRPTGNLTHSCFGKGHGVCWLFIFKVTEPSSILYRTHSACAKSTEDTVRPLMVYWAAQAEQEDPTPPGHSLTCLCILLGTAAKAEKEDATPPGHSLIFTFLFFWIFFFQKKVQMPSGLGFRVPVLGFRV